MPQIIVKFANLKKKTMEEFYKILYIVLPASAVMFGMYLTIKAFVQKELDKTAGEIKKKNNEVILPIRLQAYERICLFLERISLNNLVLRTNNPTYTVSELHAKLLTEIREEFNHNLSQQIYLSDVAWQMVRSAMEQTSSKINEASQYVNKEDRGIELAKAIFNLAASSNNDPIQEALLYLKTEIRHSF
jgi:hypothetical protein